MAAQFSIGIDLGTTNSALAFTPITSGAVPVALAIPQVVQPGQVKAQALLPSCLYLPAEGELPPGALALPWEGEAPYAVGAFARERGAGTPLRLVSSAKSWLSHAGVDRRSALLPWQAPEGVPRMSPVEASALYLEHLKAAFEAAHPGVALSDQEVVLTVPASFDAAARELTVEAARLAGFGEHLKLLEEPQAALYAWLADQGAAWRRALTVGDVLLVCDVGGGTTDFSLIAVREVDGNLSLERVAVGDHILLGGDNMDLALAYAIRADLAADGKTLDDWQLKVLTHGCRVAKEALLSDARPSYPLVIPARGSKLLGATLRTELTRERLTATLVDGFFPVVDVDARPQAPRRLGLSTLSLPYASDAAITRHLAAFLSRPTLPRPAGQRFVHPTAVLFNGGVTRAPVLRERILSVLNGWLKADGGAPVRVLDGANPDLAVCRGAAYYAALSQGSGVRIRSATARAYYLGIERAELAVPGVAPTVDAVCVAPFGMEEGAEAILPTPFGLYVGEQAAFRFFGSSDRRADPVGAVVTPDLLEELAPVETTLAGEPGAVVPVRLHARVTEVGTLDLSAVEEASGRRWRLTFDVRTE